MRIIAIALFLIVNFSFTQEDLKVNDRLGLSIDLEEREYFGLFPWEKNFKSAEIARVTRDSVVFKINKMTNESYEFGFVKTWMSLFNYYIENYESFDGSFEGLPLSTIEQWKPFSESIVKYDNSSRRASLAKFKLKNENENSSYRLLWADDENIYLTKRNNKYFDYSRIEEDLLIINYNDIEEFKIQFFFVLYSVYKIYGSEELYKEFLPKIQSKSAFFPKKNRELEFLPIELKRKIIDLEKQK